MRRLDRREAAVHLTCATRKLGLQQTLRDVAQRCAAEVVIPDHSTAAAWPATAASKYPELSASALEGEVAELASAGCDVDYSTNLTCEMALSRATGAPYRNILYLVEEASLTAGGSGVASESVLLRYLR